MIERGDATSAENRAETSDPTIDRSLLAAFRERLDTIGVESTVVGADLEEALTERIERPAVASGADGSIALPEGVTVEPTREELRAAETGITPARLGVASQGSIVIDSNEGMDGPVSLYPPKHVAVLAVEDLVPDIGTALEVLSQAFVDGDNDAVFVTGPSSTGDMGELVVGVHGPAEMEVVIVE